MSRMPSPRGILTTLSSASGPGASNHCLPRNSPAPTAIETTTSTVKMALPTTMIGWRTRREWRLGSGTLSGSSAARGLRGRRFRPADCLLSRRIHLTRSRCQHSTLPSSHRPRRGGEKYQPLSHVRKNYGESLGRSPAQTPRQRNDGKSARRLSHRNRTNSITRCRHRVYAPGGGPGRSACRPRDYRG